MEGEFIEKDAVPRKIHVYFLPFTNPVQALLDLFLAILIYRLEPYSFERQIAMLFYEIKQSTFNSVNTCLSCFITSSMATEGVRVSALKNNFFWVPH